MRIYLNRFPGGKKLAFTLSYDDTCLEQNERLIEIFNKYGAKATFHLNADSMHYFGGTYEDFRKLYAGHEISCHTLTHPHIGLMPCDNVLTEIIEDRKILEAYAGYPVRGMSYPFSSYSKPVIEALRGAGMEYSRTVGSVGHTSYIPEDFMLWNPTTHHDGNLTEIYKNYIGEINSNDMQLYYTWGHGHEFSRHGNWNVMEEFLDRASQDADKIWFATNIEIKDYITAMRQVRFSLDCTSAYNPARFSIWVTVNNTIPYELKPGYNTITVD